MNGPLRTYIVLFLLFGHAFAQVNTVGRQVYAPDALDGYTLFGSANSTTQYLIDNCGQIVHSWPGMERPFFYYELLPDGRLLRVLKNNTIEYVNWDGSIAHTVPYPFGGSGFFHHESIVLPNGNLLCTAAEYIARQLAVDAGRDTTNLGNFLVSETILEIRPDPAGDQVVWQWKLWDHLIQDFDSTKANYGVVADHPELVDLNYGTIPNLSDFFHINALDYDPEREQILMSTRFQDQVFIIDHSTTTAEAAGHTGGRYGKGGDFLYRFGNPASYRRSGPKVLYGPHDVHRIPDSLPDGGRILLFNNGWRRDTLFSEIVIIDPVETAPGVYDTLPSGAYGPASMAVVYRADTVRNFYSEFVSSAHRLANGNTMICAGAENWLFEVTPQGETVWSYISPVLHDSILAQGEEHPLFGDDYIFNALRYPVDYPPFLGLEMAPLGPVERDPLPDSCAVTYKPPEPPDPPEPVIPVGIYPVPADESLRINSGPSGEVLVFDVAGRLVFRGEMLTLPYDIDVSRWNAGMYILRLSNGQSQRISVIH